MFKLFYGYPEKTCSMVAVVQARLMCCNGIVMTSAQLAALCTLKDKPFARHVVKVKHKAKFEESGMP